MQEGRIKVLYTIPNFDTAGSGKVVFDLARSLNRSRFEVEIACSHDRGAFFKVVQSSGIRIHIKNFTCAYRPYTTLAGRLRPIVSFFKANRFDLVHSWHWSSDWTEPLASRLAGTPWIYTKKSMGWGNLHWKVRSRLAKHIVCINSDMEKMFFPGWKKISLIPIGVDTDYFQAVDPPEILRKGNDLGIGENDFVLLSVANLVPVKGIELVVNALERLQAENIRYVVVGDNANDYGRELMHAVGQRGLNGKVIFTGKVLDVRPFLALADVFLIPTKDEGRKEGLPVAPIEAMASSRIVLGSRISGIKDLLDSHQELLFEPGNVDDICRKIVYIKAMSREERRNLAGQLRQTVEERYSLRSFIAAHEELYVKLARRKSAV